MKTYKISLVILILPSLLLISCDVNSPESLLFNTPNCSIISIAHISFEHYGYATMSIKVVNDGDGPTAFGVSCSVKLKDGNLIVDDGFAEFGTLEEGEEREEDVIFFDLEETEVINRKIIFLSWYDAEEGYYYEEY
jgi:hypothetical protein